MFSVFRLRLGGISPPPPNQRVRGLKWLEHEAVYTNKCRLKDFVDFCLVSCVGSGPAKICIHLIS